MAVTESATRKASARVIAFEWTVARGYEWVSAFGCDSKDEGQYLAPNFEPGRRSRPLEETPALFLTFADTRPSRAKIRAFALAHGHLGGRALEPLAEEGSRVQDGELVATWVYSGERHGELLATWTNEIRAMSAAVELADALRSRDVASLRQRFRIANGIAHYSDGKWSSPVRFGDARDAPGPERYLRAARFLLQDVVNEKLHRETAMRLVYVSSGKGDSLERRMAPLSLLGALWMQLAESIDSALDHRRCENEKCGSWYLIRRENDRKVQHYCRAACRVASFRRRQGAPEWPRGDPI